MDSQKRLNEIEKRMILLEGNRHAILTKHWDGMGEYTELIAEREELQAKQAEQVYQANQVYQAKWQRIFDAWSLTV